ncbi:GSCOCG00004644001-RA-CDS, partial [Cotesia congregata]
RLSSFFCLLATDVLFLNLTHSVIFFWPYYISVCWFSSAQLESAQRYKYDTPFGSLLGVYLCPLRDEATRYVHGTTILSFDSKPTCATMPILFRELVQYICNTIHSNYVHF